MKRIFALILVILIFCACAPVGKNPAGVQSDAPVSDEVFTETDVFSPELYAEGVAITLQERIKNAGASSDYASIVLPLDFGCAYNMKFSRALTSLRVAVTDFDPMSVSEGKDVSANENARILRLEKTTPQDISDIVYVPDKDGQYLVIYTTDGGEREPVYIGKSVILAGRDTSDNWWYAPSCGDALGSRDSFADFKWTSDELYEKLYEPLREKYTDYITYKVLGKDQSDAFEIRAYTFEPENPEKTIILTAGVHGNDTDACIALYKFLELMCEEDGSNAGLHFLHKNVRIVAIPMVNVWASYNGHTYRNSENCNLDMDFLDCSQAETRAVCPVFNKYSKNAQLIDFRCYNEWDTTAELYFQAIPSAPNAPVVYKTINHLCENYKARGYIKDKINTEYLLKDSPLPKASMLSVAYDIYNIPGVSLYHSFDNHYRAHSNEAITVAVESLGNMVIAHANQGGK